jgi:hypothetical protein
LIWSRLAIVTVFTSVLGWACGDWHRAADQPGLARIGVEIALGLFELGLGFGQLTGDEFARIGRAVVAALQVGLDEFVGPGIGDLAESRIGAGKADRGQARGCGSRPSPP